MTKVIDLFLGNVIIFEIIFDLMSLTKSYPPVSLERIKNMRDGTSDMGGRFVNVLIPTDQVVEVPRPSCLSQLYSFGRFRPGRTKYVWDLCPSLFPVPTYGRDSCLKLCCLHQG